MSHSYRHYRQVKIIKNGQSSSPQIDGFEEIVYDGKRKVYYWNNPIDRSRWDEDDFLLSSVLDPDNDWLDTDELSEGIRYLNPHEVIIRDLTYPHRKKTYHSSKLSQIKTSIQKGITYIKKIAQRFPLALKAAWSELTNND
ncbi:MAG: hypothetical protein QNJ37_17060 [Crocosphaera sp.]|nr:hypothetical protein [Crocosphaera sp.]